MSLSTVPMYVVVLHNVGLAMRMHFGALYHVRLGVVKRIYVAGVPEMVSSPVSYRSAKVFRVV